jgi:hypothetical protein
MDIFTLLQLRLCMRGHCEAAQSWWFSYSKQELALFCWVQVHLLEAEYIHVLCAAPSV